MGNSGKETAFEFAAQAGTKHDRVLRHLRAWDDAAAWRLGLLVARNVSEGKPGRPAKNVPLGTFPLATLGCIGKVPGQRSCS